jgi:hypothetical protein
MSIDISAEVQGLQQSIEYAKACLEVAEMIGTTGGEDFLAHLAETDNGPATLGSASRVQEVADDLQAELTTLLDLLEGQLQVKEASDAINGEHGNKAFFAAE